MKQSDNFSYYLTKFLKEYLPGQRNLSTNTILSYRDTFVKLITFCRDDKNMSPDKLKISTFDKDMVEDFLNYLEKEQHCSISTRNQRLAAMKSFFKYVQVEEPEHLFSCQGILGIIAKKKEKPVITYLSPDEIRTLLSCPDTSTKRGRRNLAILSLLYDSAARVQELCDMEVCDIRTANPPVACLYGKGRKGREIPLSKDCAKLIEKYISENGLDRPGHRNIPLFFNNRNEKLTRSGISYILAKYMDQAASIMPSITDKKITPHCLRHSKAMHLVEAGVNLIYIRDFLGHESVETTQIYAKANPESVRKAVEKVNEKNSPIDMPDWRDDPDLMAMLKSL